MMQLLVEPLSYEFMRRALFAAALTGAITSLVGTYVVLRGMAFLGGALSHAVLPGAAVAYVWGHSTALGAFIAGLLTAAGIGFIGRHPDLKQDTAIGILMSGMFALGIAIISTIKTYSVDLANFLFGNVLAVSMDDIWLMIGISALILLILWLFHHRWVILGFDPSFAAAVGLPVGALHYGLMVSISLVIVAAMKVVGVIQVLAMLVTPPATARLLSNRLSTMMWLSAMLGSVAAVVGLYVSYYLNIASGAAIVIVSVILFFAVFLGSPRRVT
ncbi:MAG: metal ABC transporter permease [Limnochordia bacterium]|jgi:ABC-type Mn2+/Zn2+ transport system permease subunit